MEAYIFVNCKAGKSWEIADEARRIENVKMVHAVTGQYDVVAYIDFTSMEDLTSVLGKFQTMDGIEKTHTAVAIQKVPD